MGFHKRLKEFREEMGMKPAELARLLKTSPSNISRYESGKMAVSLGTVQDFAKKLGIHPSWLLDWQDDKYYDTNIPYRKIPVIGQIRDENILSVNNHDGLEIIGSGHGVDFCVKIKDDRMTAAGINVGDTVFLRKQDIVENGDIVGVVDGDRIAIRRYHKYGEQIVLREEGTRPKDTESSDAQIVGKAVMVLAGVG